MIVPKLIGVFALLTLDRGTFWRTRRDFCHRSPYSLVSYILNKPSLHQQQIPRTPSFLMLGGYVQRHLLNRRPPLIVSVLCQPKFTASSTSRYLLFVLWFISRNDQIGCLFPHRWASILQAYPTNFWLTALPLY